MKIKCNEKQRVITIFDEKGNEKCKEEMAAKLKINNNKVMFIKPYEFELQGEVYIGNLTDLDNIKKLKIPLEDDKSVKDIAWLDDGRILLIIGYYWGTVSTGGDLYQYNLHFEKLDLIAKFPDEIQLDTIHEINQREVHLKGIIYTDAIMNEYIDYEKKVSLI
ncbi:DUF4652 domain-containing protein [Sporosarcina sp. P26b]|uniref:DUF4652 domain-containing protein n=1 Tax=Sporosarcina sp. P26b TaxID=2048253 RepID=UPI0013044426|nr:DUF4652 domain-containing protein [Sporosarcina sp. P26b]